MARGDGSVYWSKSRDAARSYIWLTRTDGSQYRHQLPDQPTKAAARKRLREALVARDQGRFAHTPQETLADFLDTWRETVYVHSGVRDSTIRRVDNLLSALKAHLGGVSLRDLNPSRIDTAYNEIRATRGAAIAHNAASKLRMALNCAVDWQLLAANPADRAHPPRYRPPPADFLTRDETAHLLAVLEDAPGPWDVIFPLILHTGIRAGEACALRWQDIDLAGTLEIHATHTRTLDGKRTTGPPKSRASRRTIQLSDTAIALLERHKRRRTGINPYVFPGRDGGVRNPLTLNRALARECSHAGIRQISPHTLRHTHASIDLAAGGD
jgi:integrase